MLQGIEAVIFDLDGTLVDSMGVWTDIDDIFLKKYGLEEPKNFHEGMEGKSFSETAQYFLDLFPSLSMKREDLEQEWLDMAYEMYTSQIHLKPGAYEFIKKLYGNGVRLGIATSNNRALAEACLAFNGVLEFFGAIWTSCEAKAGKPNPAVYLCVADSLGVRPENCLVFEDVPMGILAGKNAGMRTCAVEDWFSKLQEEKKRELADYFIKSYYDIENGTYEVLR